MVQLARSVSCLFTRPKCPIFQQPRSKGNKRVAANHFSEARSARGRGQAPHDSGPLRTSALSQHALQAEARRRRTCRKERHAAHAKRGAKRIKVRPVRSSERRSHARPSPSPPQQTKFGRSPARASRSLRGGHDLSEPWLLSSISPRKK